METPDFVPYMTSFIKKYDYPLVHAKNSEEIAEVFHISNRCFLVSWAFILLHEDCYQKILTGREQDKALLADLVYCHGFCNETEKLGFFSGDLALEQQVQILHRIFKFIERQKEAETQEFTDPVTLDALLALSNKDLNLFPIYGDMKALSEEERLCKVNEVKTKREQLTSENKKVMEQSDLHKVSDIKKEYITSIVNDIHDNLKQFDRVVKSIGKETSSKVEPNYKIDPTSEELLRNCNDYLKILTEFIANLKTINECALEDIQMPIDELSPLIEILAEQIQTSIILR